MKKQNLFVLMLVALMTTTVSAQSGNDSGGQGYVFAAPGALLVAGSSESTLHIGGGGEGFLTKGLALGGEVGYLTPFTSFSDGLGIASVNISAHFGRGDSDRKAIPYITGGYSLAFRSDTLNMINFGGGVNYWVKDNLGVQFEIRDHTNIESLFVRVHFWQARIGLVFR